MTRTVRSTPSTCRFVGLTCVARLGLGRRWATQGWVALFQLVFAIPFALPAAIAGGQIDSVQQALCPPCSHRELAPYAA
jgi:hypothetical protein